MLGRTHLKIIEFLKNYYCRKFMITNSASIKEVGPSAPKSLHPLGNAPTGQDKSKVGSFLPITTKRSIKHTLGIKQSSLLASVTWESAACGLNDVPPTIGVTAEAWREWWAFQPAERREVRPILYSPAETVTNVLKKNSRWSSEVAFLVLETVHRQRWSALTKEPSRVP